MLGNDYDRAIRYFFWAREDGGSCGRVRRKEPHRRFLEVVK